MSDSAPSDLKIQLDKALEDLTEIFKGNTKKVKALVFAFVDETPRLLDELWRVTQTLKRSETRELIHKIKIRYGYFGITDVVERLSTWERKATNGDVESIINEFPYVRNTNDKVIELLKLSNFFEPVRIEEPAFASGKVVMIAEDDDINALVFELLIKETGATVIVVKDGAEALSRALEAPPDVIFMDVHMPFLDGLQVISKLRADGLSCSIIALSASNRQNERQNALDAGANEFMLKPLDRDTLHKLLERHLA